MRILQLTIIVAALSSATAMAIRESASVDREASAAASETQWKCRSCALAVRLTAFDVSKLSQGSYGPSMAIKCPSCGEAACHLARVCPVCRSVYLGSEVPGGDDHCRSCREQGVVPSEVEPEQSLEFFPVSEEGGPERNSPPKPPVKVI